MCVHAGKTAEVPARLPADRANDLFSGEVWLWEGAALGSRICCHSRSAESCLGGAREQMPFGETGNTVTTRLYVPSLGGGKAWLTVGWKCRRSLCPCPRAPLSLPVPCLWKELTRSRSASSAGLSSAPGATLMPAPTDHAAAANTSLSCCITRPGTSCPAEQVPGLYPRGPQAGCRNGWTYQVLLL